MPIHSFLLQMPVSVAAAPAVSAAAVAAIFLSALSLLFAFISLVRRESREDGQTVNQRLKKLEASSGLHDTQTTLLTRQLEDWTNKLHAEVVAEADKAAGARLALSAEFERRCAVLEKEVSQVPALREGMARMEEKLKGIDKIEAKLDRLYDLLTHAQAKK